MRSWWRQQTASGLALVLGTWGGGIAAAEPVVPELSRLQWGSLSLYTENDKYFAGTDQHYTNGFKLSALSARLNNFTSEPVPAYLQRVARSLQRLLPDGHDYKLGLSFGQNLYTPVDLDTPELIPGDRPYAAWLYGGAAFHVYTPARPLARGWRAVSRLDTVEVTLGWVGPGALGKEVQDFVHDLIDVDRSFGWDNQIGDELGLNIVFERKLRWSTTGARTGWGADLIPHAGVSLGNVFTYANLGAELRFGYRLPADFGTQLIRPSGDSSGNLRPRYSAFVFTAFNGRAVARDITLDGNTWRDSHSVEKETLVADVHGGFAIASHRWQLTYTQAVRTREFTGQRRHSVFGSASISFYY